MAARGMGWASIILIACGGSTPAPQHGASTKGAPVASAPTLSDAERAACGHKEGAELDSLACLVAERARLDAGDAAGAKAVVAYGCEQGDLDACQDLRALEPARAAEIDGKITSACAAMGDIGKKLGACLRGRATGAISSDELAASVPIELGIELRARYAPALLAQLPSAARACRAALDGTTVPTLAGTPVARDSSIVDAAIDCDGLDISKVTAKDDGIAISTSFVVRSLHDGLLSDGKTLRVSAPTGPAETGVYCPSLLVDADDAADVWARAKVDGVTTRVLATVHTGQPCLTEKGRAARATERAALRTIVAPVAQAIDAALSKLASVCDAAPASIDRRKAPLAGDAIEHTPHVVSFEPSCAFGFRSVQLATSKPLNHPNPMSSEHEFASVGDHAARVEAIEHRPGILELTFRRGNAQLVVGVKK